MVEQMMNGKRCACICHDYYHRLDIHCKYCFSFTESAPADGSFMCKLEERLKQIESRLEILDELRRIFR